MAEGILRKLAGQKYEAFSAGSKPAGFVHPLAIEVMNEFGADISKHRSKSLQEFVGQPFNYVITVCDNAKESCPVFPGNTKRLHWSFEDPAAVQGTEDQRNAAFRRIRNEIHERIQGFVRATAIL